MEQKINGLSVARINEMLKQRGAQFYVEPTEAPKNGYICSMLMLKKYVQNAMVHGGLSIPAGNLPHTYSKMCDTLLAIDANMQVPSEQTVGMITSSEYIAENVFPQLLSVKGNEALLDKVHHDRFLDLAVVFRVNCFPALEKECEEFGSASYLLTNNAYEAVCGSIDVMECALRNLRPHIAIIEVPMPFDDIPSMFAITTDEWLSYSFGAAAMLDSPTFENLCTMVGTDKLFVLPSSINDVMVLPYDHDLEDEAKRMVAYANRDRNVVAEHEVLTDTVYVYTKGNGFSIIP